MNEQLIVVGVNKTVTRLQLPFALKCEFLLKRHIVNGHNT